MGRISKLEIEQFRLLTGTCIKLADKVTVIAGLNGLGKSTVLGMLGQPFTDGGLGSQIPKTILGKRFKYQFSDGFRFSDRFDIAGDHRFTMWFSTPEDFNGRESFTAKTYERHDGKGIRFYSIRRGKGEGNISFPVIYLGLKRVYPLGEVSRLKEASVELFEDECKLFNEWTSRVFASFGSVSPSPVDGGREKKTLAMGTDTYDYSANSAGQDNMGQIFESLLSFRRLKNTLADDYHGGLFLIDEIDATVFPGAQVNLLDLLVRMAGKLDIQIVFTTHSMSLLEHAVQMSERPNDDVVINYLTDQFGEVENIINPSVDDIRSDLNMLPLQPSSDAAGTEKVEVICEDRTSAWFIRKLMNAEVRKLVFVNGIGRSSADLRTMHDSNVKSLSKCIFILDGDMHLITRDKKDGRLLFLPGDNKSPECVFYSFLFSLPGNDSFWRNERHYDKRTFLNTSSDAMRDRDTQGKWFRKMKSIDKNWGQNGELLYKRWAKEQEAEINAFNERLMEAVRLVRQ